MKDNVKEIFHELKQSMLTGVSYMLPFVVAGGILIAVAFALGGMIEDILCPAIRSISSP